MKTLLLPALVLAVFLGTSSASPPSTGSRTIKDVSAVIPLRVLQRSVSPKFYKSLRISPIKGWIVVRAQLSGTRLSGIRVVRSSLNGAYDPLALELADEVRIAGAYSLGKVVSTHSVLMHLLIYQIADGTMALSFAHLDQPGGEQNQYFGCAKLSVRKSDGRWTEIKGPENLQGKGWAVRDSARRNDYKTTLGMEHIFNHDTSPREAYFHHEHYDY
jgi:hypothetical protein